MPVFGPDVKEGSGIVAGEFKRLGLYPCSVSLCIHLPLSVSLISAALAASGHGCPELYPPSLAQLLTFSFISSLSFCTKTSLLGLSLGISHRHLSLTRSTLSLSSTKACSSLCPGPQSGAKAAQLPSRNHWTSSSPSTRPIRADPQLPFVTRMKPSNPTWPHRALSTSPTFSAPSAHLTPLCTCSSMLVVFQATRTCGSCPSAPLFLFPYTSPPRP